ncbi:MAG: pentapeptide repeat-containing protein [Gammaproteobacteria bacterium]
MEQPKVWQGKFADGTPLTQTRLKELLTAHKRWWLQIAEKKLREATYKGSVKAEDREAWVSSLVASDWEADQGRLVLEGASLVGVNLQGAQLSYFNLRTSMLLDANLKRAVLLDANLKLAVLWDANLQGAVLWLANLQETQLSGANLEGAVLWDANLQGALYQPDSAPDIHSLAKARHLETMRFASSPDALEDLRREFKNRGYTKQERQITHALKRSEHENAWRDGEYIDSVFKYVFFYLPVGYGLYPGRALWILAVLVGAFTLPYAIAIGRPSQKSHIYRFWPERRIDATGNTAQVADSVKIERLDARSWRIFSYALYFSLLSAFHIGRRELNVGNWIARLQLHPYTLQATGWVRTVSGFQSLISVYLLALWALSYFGRPFE